MRDPSRLSDFPPKHYRSIATPDKGDRLQLLKSKLRAKFPVSPSYHNTICPIFHGGLSFAYLASRCPFMKLKTAKKKFPCVVTYVIHTWYVPSGNEHCIAITKIKTHENFVNHLLPVFMK